MRASRALPDDEMQKIREYAAMLIDKYIKDEREKKKNLELTPFFFDVILTYVMPFPHL